MKNLYLLVILVTFSIFSCDNPIDPEPDLSDTVPGFVELTSTSYSYPVDSAAMTLSVLATVQIRTAKTEDVIVDYEYSGDQSGSGSVVISSSQLKADLDIEIEPSLIDSGSINLMLTGVNQGLEVGRRGLSNDLSPVTALIEWSK